MATVSAVQQTLQNLFKVLDQPLFKPLKAHFESYKITYLLFMKDFPSRLLDRLDVILHRRLIIGCGEIQSGSAILHLQPGGHHLCHLLTSKLVYYTLHSVTFYHWS